MKPYWKALFVPMSLAFLLLAGCAPVPVKPENLPGQSQDPGRFEESAADTAPTKREENEQRQRAVVKRLDVFESSCNVVSFFFGLLIKDTLCAGPVTVKPAPGAQFL